MLVGLQDAVATMKPYDKISVARNEPRCEQTTGHYAKREENLHVLWEMLREIVLIEDEVVLSWVDLGGDASDYASKIV